ncbi:MAG: PLDc N-terminal domain-containing protein [Actinobacteria bacterium]|nr:PLDc N-terminal domain-containing protein [Actinomycetota bacterium]
MAKRKREKQRWSDLPPARRRAIVVAGVAQVTLQLCALIDLRRRPAARVRGSKRLWAAASFVNWLGPLAYFAFGRLP